MTYPIVRQRDPAGCGPACLAMISKYHGKRRSVARLRIDARTDERGTSLAGLIRAGSRIGFDCRGVRAAPEGLEAVALPAIAHWNENGRHHFVVVYEVSRTAVIVGDPAAGMRRMPRDEFGRRWTGILLLVE